MIIRPKPSLRIGLFFKRVILYLVCMADNFIIHDIYVPNHKTSLQSVTSPLKCHVCKKELDGVSITARVVDGKAVFLCPVHLKVSSRLEVSVS